MREKTMRALMYSAIPISAFVVILVCWAVYHGTVRRTSTGVTIRVARDTCQCGSSRVIALHVLSDGALRINFDDVTRRELGSRLKDIYEARAEKVIYLAAEPEASFADVADASSIAQKYVDEILLITPQAIETPCCDSDCYNFTHHSIIVPSALAISDAAPDAKTTETAAKRVPPCPEPPYSGALKLPVPAELQ